MVIIDGSGMFYKIVFGNKKDIIVHNEYQLYYFKHLILHEIIRLTQEFGCSKENRMIIALDSKPYWRTKYFDKYKHRYFKDFYKADKAFDIDGFKYKGKRKKDESIDFDLLWKITGEMIELLSTVSDIISLKVKEAEADDIIATIALHLKDKEEVFIISGDKDFKQLISNKNVHLYNYSPFRKESDSDFHHIEDVAKFLEYHILFGDISDNIPHVKDKLGEKAVEKLQNTSDGVKMLLEDDNVNFRYKINKKMIDLTQIPYYITKDIMNKYNKVINEYNYDYCGMIDYCMENGLNNISNKIDSLNLKPFKIITKLNSYFKN